MSKRICPVCENADDQERIYAVVNVNNSHVTIAGCLCTACEAEWSEWYYKKTEETVNKKCSPKKARVD